MRSQVLTAHCFPSISWTLKLLLPNRHADWLSIINTPLWKACHHPCVSLGPSLWHKDYPVAQGSRQSPIDIVPSEASFDPRLPPIQLSYDQCTSINISNNGHSVVVEFDDSDDRSGERLPAKMLNRCKDNCRLIFLFILRKRLRRLNWYSVYTYWV